MKWLIGSIALVALAACGENGNVSNPTPTSSTLAARPVLPAYMDGWFVTGAGIVGRSQPGQTYIIVPSWSEDAEAVARELERTNSFALVSAWHVFSNPRETWSRDWEQTRTWFQPIERSGRLIGVYALDEPYHNGIAGGQESIEVAISMVRASGYRTMTSETLQMWRRFRYRPTSDWFGFTHVGDPWNRVEETTPDPSFNVSFSDQSGRTCELARRSSKVGCLRWSIDMGGW